MMEQVTCDTCGQTCRANQIKKHKNSAVCKGIVNVKKYNEFHGESNDELPIAQILIGNFEGGSKMSEKHIRQLCKKYGSYESVVGSKRQH